MQSLPHPNGAQLTLLRTLAEALEYVRGLPCFSPAELDQVLGETPRKLFGFP